MRNATLYTRSGDGLQAVTVPQSLANEVAALQRKVKELRAAMREARDHLYGGRPAQALVELNTALHRDSTRP